MEHSEDQLRKDKDDHCVGGLLKAKVQAAGHDPQKHTTEKTLSYKKVVKIHWECV